MLIDGAPSKSPWLMAPIHGVETFHLNDLQSPWLYRMWIGACMLKQGN